MYDSLAAGEIEPLVSEVLAFGQVPDALHCRANRATTGRLVLDPRQL